MKGNPINKCPSNIGCCSIYISREYMPDECYYGYACQHACGVPYFQDDINSHSMITIKPKYREKYNSKLDECIPHEMPINEFIQWKEKLYL